MLKVFLWLRYLRKRKIVILSIIAVAMSVALLMVVDSLFTGFINALSENLVGEFGDISLWARGKSIPRYETFIEKLQGLEGVKAAAPFAFSGGLLRLSTGDVREVTIEGIDLKWERGFTNWRESLLRQDDGDKQPVFDVPGHEGQTGGWLGVNIVAEPNRITDEYDRQKIRSFVGRQVLLITSGYGGKRRVFRFTVADVALTQTYLGDQTVYLPFDKWYEFYSGREEAGRTRNIKIKLEKGVRADSTWPAIQAAWKDFACNELGWSAMDAESLVIRSQQELHSRYFSEVFKQMGVVMLIFGVICSVAILLVFCIFYMIVESKRKDIAIMKSCGASGWSAASIFTGFGACVGLVGSGAGIVIGYLVTRNVNTLEEWVRLIFGLKLWRSSSYGLNMIPHEVDWSGVWPIVLAAVLGCCLGSLVPAIMAARTRPVNILRYE